MSNPVLSPVMLYTEQTPNPESLKFVTNRMLFKGTADFGNKELADEWSPLGVELFELPYVKGVYISNNFVTITKEFNYSWQDIMLDLKEFLKSYIAEGKPVVNEGYEEAVLAKQREAISEEYSGDEADVVIRIKNLIETYVKPAVANDGGNIEFKSYKDGIVTVVMQGSCSGCPSSTVTLKAGIEGMMKRMVPEVKEVISEMG